jgi:hypothetical protein
VASRVREVQTLTEVSVVSVGLTVVDRGLIRPDRFGAVVERLESGPDVIEAGLEFVRAGVLYIVQCCHSRRVLAGINLDASLVCLGRPLTRTTLVPRARRQQGDRCIKILDDVSDCFGAGLVRFAEIGVVFAVVRDVAPHPIGLEVVMRSQEQRLTLDALGVRGVNLTRATRDHFVQQANSGIGS